MTIFLLQSDTAKGTPCPQASMRNYVRERGVFLLGGPPVAQRLPNNIYFEVLDGETPGLADFMTGVGFMLVSEQLKRVLESISVEVEFISVSIKYRNRLRQGHYLANPLNVIRGVNVEASSLELNSVGIAITVDRLVLNEALFANTPLSVIHEIEGVAVQGDVADTIKASACVGCSFVLPDSIRI